MKKLKIPFIHIAQVTGEAIAKQNLMKVGLLGTRFTMEHGFFSNRLSTLGIQTITPEVEDRNFIHQSIFEELSRGIYTENTRQYYLQTIERLKQIGAEGIIFGCSEISLLIKPEECLIPVFDTTLIHARAAVNFALKA